MNFLPKRIAFCGPFCNYELFGGEDEEALSVFFIFFLALFTLSLVFSVFEVWASSHPQTKFDAINLPTSIFPFFIKIPSLSGLFKIWWW